MKAILYISFFAFMFSACQSSTAPNQNIVTPTPNGVPSAAVQNTAPAAPRQTASAGQRPANNPPHGQPFHDCAIPVGAPLAATTTGAQIPAPAAAPSAQAPQLPAGTDKEVKLNPPHGQPGHSCEIAVGAPLT